jgi:hypothetical protein
MVNGAGGCGRFAPFLAVEFFKLLFAPETKTADWNNTDVFQVGPNLLREST